MIQCPFVFYSFYYYYIIMALLLAVLFFTYWMDKSKLGYYLKAIKGSHMAAASLGVSPTKMKLTANGISAFFSGIGGVFYAQWILFINPERILGLGLNVDILIICMIGGFGTIFGPILGAVLMVPIAELTRVYLGTTYLGSYLILYGLILIVCVYFLPDGIIRPLSEVYKRFLTSKRPSGGAEER